MRPFRFGVLHMSAVADGADWLDGVRRVERAGYSTLLLSDHFERTPLAPVPAMMAAAMATDTLRIGSLVFANDFRQPAVLAKEMATIDLLSGGRVEVGLGAGWMTEDYTQAGIAFDPPGRRIDRLAETLDLFEQALAGETAQGGSTYPVRDLAPVPAPVQRPRPPLLVGGGGPRMLRLAARRADIVSVNWTLPGGRFDSAAIGSGDTSHTDQQLGWIRDAAGERFADLELHLQVYLAAITDDPLSVAEAWRAQLRFDIDADALLDSPHVLVGSLESIVDKLERQRERWGFSYVSFYDSATEVMLPVVAQLGSS